jgi:(R,R)-butanediol dehydrogenase/meso-butanediol dehydrogenase/diacetyl reductase
MLAARYMGDARIDVTEQEPSAPRAGEVRVAVAFTGICGTDLHILHGAMDARVTTPAIIGHEMSGLIVALGDQVEGWGVGDAVTVMPLRWCGDCPACRAGNAHICQNLDFVWNVPAELLVRLPAGMSLRDAALVEPTAVAVHDVRRAQLQPDEKAVVVGGGPVGLLIATVARSVGADVLVLELDPYRRSVAESVGLRTLDPAAVDVSTFVSQWTAGAGAAVSFEVSGSQPGADTALDVLGVRGRMVVVGIHPQPRAISLHRVFWRELTLVGARVYQRIDFERAIELVAAGEVAIDALVSRIEPLTSARAAFAALESGGNVMKVLIDCQSR